MSITYSANCACFLCTKIFLEQYIATQIQGNIFLAHIVPEAIILSTLVQLFEVTMKVKIVLYFIAPLCHRFSGRSERSAKCGEESVEFYHDII